MRFERKLGKDKLEEIEMLEYSYTGGSEYIDMVLSQHPRESDDNYAKRKKLAYYINYCATVIDLYTQYLFRENVTRDYGSMDKVLEPYLEDADMMNRSHEQVMRMISKLSAVQKYTGIVVDRPQTSAISKAEELAAGIHPYLSIYDPECIWDWEIERINGRPTLINVVLSEGDDKFKVWTATEWQLWKQKGQDDAVMINAGVNPLGYVPFVLHRNRDSLEPEMFDAMSDIERIAPVNKAIFAIDMYACEIIDDTAFAMLTGPDDTRTESQDGGDVTVGTSSYLGRRPGDVEFGYVEPAHTSLGNLLQWRGMYVDELHRIAKVSSANATQVKSGVALEIEFQDLNAMLSEKAENCEMTENRIFAIIADWEGTTFDGYVEYPRKFGVRDLAHDLDIALKSLTVVPSPTFKRALAKDSARRVLRDPDQDTLDIIDRELDTANSTLEAINGNAN